MFSVLSDIALDLFNKIHGRQQLTCKDSFFDLLIGRLKLGGHGEVLFGFKFIIYRRGAENSELREISRQNSISCFEIQLFDINKTERLICLSTFLNSEFSAPLR